MPVLSRLPGVTIGGDPQTGVLKLLSAFSNHDIGDELAPQTVGLFTFIVPLNIIILPESSSTI